MATLFEKIIAGELPGKFVYADDVCVVFATIAPVRPGHVLVVPREAYNAWTDMPEELAAHIMKVGHRIGKAQLSVYECERIGLEIAGFEVPHAHLHVIPLRDENDLVLAEATQVSERVLESTISALRSALEEQGHEANVPLTIDSPALA
ncbi:histidine triad domain protein [Gleimia coleocanis DSM 15436]|uniref:Histidine triad domain protein n=1 Tax=Gleimia coleocanis DSM 15436 TaxID=525245 RepID=C0W1A5_9ACTO|nr:HIT family protein [Gleimia coleocanis]EEH63594.1 histidine triad domain protein [Gleimia coleocanis DSM 15436]